MHLASPKFKKDMSCMACGTILILEKSGVSSEPGRWKACVDFCVSLSHYAISQAW